MPWAAHARRSHTVTAGPHLGRIFDFREHDTFIVGRSKKAHFRLVDRDDALSRLHAVPNRRSATTAEVFDGRMAIGR